MPEGPEIRKIADQLSAVLVGRRLVEAEITLPSLQSAAAMISGRSVERVTSRGKALLIEFSGNQTLYSHNQLYGIWKIVRRGMLPSTNRQLRVALHTREHSALLFSATDVSLWKTDELCGHPFLSKLGPDVLDESLTPGEIVSRLQDIRFSRRGLSSLYLDQGFVAGIGNYLRSEILFDAKLRIDARPHEIVNSSLVRLAKSTLKISRRSYATGGRTVTKKIASSLAKQEGGFENYRFSVFGRDGKECVVCDTKIRKTNANSRRIYWCPRCQLS